MGIFGEILGALGPVVAQTLQVSLPALAAGAVVKHGGKLTKWIPNDIIPALNGVGGVIIGTMTSGGDAQAGVMMGIQAMTGATTVHQMTKTGARSLFSWGARKFTSRIMETPAKRRLRAISSRVGPGDRLSL